MNIAPGYCQCGCGLTTTQYKRNDSRAGRVKGEFARYVQNHHPQGSASRDAMILAEYSAALNMATVSRSCDVSVATVSNVLRRNGIIPRGPGHHLAKPLDHNAFDSISEESAYWIGFLMADGCVSQPSERRTQTISVNLSARDIEHLFAFRSFLKSEHKVHEYIRNESRICGNKHTTGKINVASFVFASERIANRLAEFGVVPRKTKIAQCKGGLEWNRHFWRGVVDGDGCLSIHNVQLKHFITQRPTIQVCGSIGIVNQFADFVNKSLPSRKRKVKVHPFSTIWKCAINGQDAIRITKILYGDCAIALSRKLEMARRIDSIPLVDCW